MMIDTNVKGLLYVSKYVLDIMIEKNRGHIVNIGSIAGKKVYQKETSTVLPSLLLMQFLME